MREPVQLQFDFMDDLPAPASKPEPVSDPIKSFAVLVTMLEAIGAHYAAERQAARRAFGLAT